MFSFFRSVSHDVADADLVDSFSSDANTQKIGGQKHKMGKILHGTELP